MLNDQTWNVQTLNSPIASKLHQPQSLDDSIRFGRAEKLDVHIPLRTAFCDDYIDDFLSVGIDIKEEVTKIQQAPTITVHAFFRLVAPDEPISRDDPISAKKLAGEGTPHEQKMMLGWSLCTRSCRIYLSMDKATAWSSDIDKLLLNQTVSPKTL